MRTMAMSRGVLLAAAGFMAGLAAPAHVSGQTTSAVGAVVAGLALQDTLGNFVAGLAIQVEKPFRLGHWIRLGEWEGEVAEITWRAVKVRTRDGNQVIIPNGELSKSALTNYSEPAAPTRVHVEVGAAYEHPPSAVKAAIHEGRSTTSRSCCACRNHMWCSPRLPTRPSPTVPTSGSSG